jgi:cellulose synthase/poly-beta-1,6-N-acetylglucosamine synthase-like glycosyltransferase
MKLVSIITPTTGNPILLKNIQSVRNQTYKNIQHLIVIDGAERQPAVLSAFSSVKFPVSNPLKETVVALPYSVGKDRWNGHRMYAAMTYLCEGEYVMFLDEDNFLEPDHVESCMKVIESGKDWTFSYRKIVDKEGKFICNDDCESLGNWPSVLDQTDYFIDVNCYFLPKILAVYVSPIWYRKAREPGVPEVDRVLCPNLKQMASNHDSTYNYSVNYTVGNSELSVTANFFQQGNAEMLRRYNGSLPWKRGK